jgi:hypothetical protein
MGLLGMVRNLQGGNVNALASNHGYEITGAALTGGVLEFHCVWVPLSSDGLVEAGAGGAL